MVVRMVAATAAMTAATAAMMVVAPIAAIVATAAMMAMVGTAAAMLATMVVGAAGDPSVSSAIYGDMKLTTAAVASTPTISDPSNNELQQQPLYHGFRDNISPDKRAGPHSHPCGAGLSISHIGHSFLASLSLHPKNILHVPDAHLNLLSVYRLVCDNDVFVEFHRHFSCVKDKATRRVLLLGRSQRGL
jgi:hypothetical protein